MTSTSSPQPTPGGTGSSRRNSPKVSMNGLYKRAVRDAFSKLDPRISVGNPVMFIVWVGTIVTFLVTLDPNLFGTVQTDGNKERILNGSITFILFSTVMFANFAEAIAEGRGKAQAESLKSSRSDTIANKVLPDGTIEQVSSTALRKGDRVKVALGEMIPADGEVVVGVASVDESAITGESAPVLKQPGTDIASSVTGGTRVVSDELTIQITADPGQGFIDRMIALVEGAKRSKTPNEIALTVFLAVLTQVFLIVVATLSPLAN